MFIAWKDWTNRKTPELQQDELVERLADANSWPDAGAVIFVSSRRRSRGWASPAGSRCRSRTAKASGWTVLQERTQAITRSHRRQSSEERPDGQTAVASHSTFRAGVPQVYLNIDREKAEKMGVKVNDIFATLQANLGSVYVNDFNKFGRTYQVRVQADARFRGDTSVIRRLEVPGREPEVQTTTVSAARPAVPARHAARHRDRVGPQSIIRYNLYPPAPIQRRGRAGRQFGRGTQGDGGDRRRRYCRRRWGSTGPASPSRRSDVSGEAFSSSGWRWFSVYLVLAALYESWLLPFAVILVVPLGLARGRRGREHPARFDNNIYTQIGIVLIIALASKNAILIVEFARELRLAGRSIRDAAIEASRMRFRPIIMTSFAFILGVVPLVFATGAGAASRQSLGTAVFGGMITATVLAVFFVPVFYVAIQSLIELKNGPPKLRPGQVIHAPLVDEPAAPPAPDAPSASSPDTIPPSPNGEDGKPEEKNGTPEKTKPGEAARSSRRERSSFSRCSS